jgi:hypothetical protein
MTIHFRMLLQRRVWCKSVAVLDYNSNVGGVDKNNSELQSYKMTHDERHCKYYQKMYSYMLNIICLNSHIIYWKKGGLLPADSS